LTYFFCRKSIFGIKAYFGEILVLMLGLQVVIDPHLSSPEAECGVV